jgi:transporter family-2 protein
MNNALSLLLAIAVGALLPLQVAMNMQLRAWFRDPIVAALPNFVVGTVLLVAYLPLARSRPPSAASLTEVPLWAWLGGIIGASYVIASLYLGPKIGATLLLALILAGQMAMSLAVDHFGLLGFPQHPINLPRLAGVVMLVAGALLIVKT